MSLTAKLEAGPGQARARKCRIGAAFDHFGPEDAESLRRMLDDRDEYGQHAWTGRKIADALRAEGWRVSDQAVNRHRRGICQCGTDQ